MKYLIFSFFAVIFSFGSFSQLDSVNVTYSITEVPNLEDSLLSFENLEVQVWVNDFDFFGELIVDVIYHESQNLFSMVEKSKSDILNDSLINNSGWITILIDDLPLNTDWDIKVQVRNHDGLNLPQFILNHIN